MAGWFDSGYFDVSQTRVTVSFPDTDPSTIQEDNWIAGGMFVTGMDSVLRQTDYGFCTALTLDHNGNLYVDVSVHMTYEALPPDFPYGPLPWTRLLYNATVHIGGVSPSTPITLTARWDEPSGMVYWDYQVSDDSPQTLTPFNVVEVAPTIIRRFYVGTVDLGFIWIPYMLAYDLQFGTYSNYNIGHGGWNVKLEFPLYYTDMWHNVEAAKSIGGASAFFDAAWKWGGEDYEGVNANYYMNEPSLGRVRSSFSLLRLNP